MKFRISSTGIVALPMQYSNVTCVAAFVTPFLFYREETIACYSRKLASPALSGCSRCIRHYRTAPKFLLRPFFSLVLEGVTNIALLCHWSTVLSRLEHCPRLRFCLPFVPNNRPTWPETTHFPCSRHSDLAEERLYICGFDNL